MAVAKRQGRSKEGPRSQSENFRQNKQHSWLSPICIGQAQVEEKTYKRRSQSAFSGTLSPTCMCALSFSLSLFLSLSLSPSPCTPPLPSLRVLDSPATFQITWSCNADLPKSCSTVCPRPKSCDTPRALMSIAPNLCCHETKNRGT